jgi:hypothetical protein
MFPIAYIISQDLMLRHNIGARGSDPVVPERGRRRARRPRAGSPRRSARDQRTAAPARVTG